MDQNTLSLYQTLNLLDSMYLEDLTAVSRAAERTSAILISDAYKAIKGGLEFNPKSKYLQRKKLELLSDMWVYAQAGRDFNKKRKLVGYDDFFCQAVGEDLGHKTFEVVDRIYEELANTGDFFQEEEFDECLKLERPEGHDFLDYSDKSEDPLEPEWV